MHEEITSTRSSKEKGNEREREREREILCFVGEASDFGAPLDLSRAADRGEIIPRSAEAPESILINAIARSIDLSQRECLRWMSASKPAPFRSESSRERKHFVHSFARRRYVILGFHLSILTASSVEHRVSISGLGVQRGCRARDGDRPCGRISGGK